MQSRSAYLLQYINETVALKRNLKTQRTSETTPQFENPNKTEFKLKHYIRMFDSSKEGLKKKSS